MSNGQVLLFDGWWGWRRAHKIYFPDSKLSGAFLLVLRVWLEAWGAWAGRVVVQEI